MKKTGDFTEEVVGGVLKSRRVIEQDISSLQPCETLQNDGPNMNLE